MEFYDVLDYAHIVEGLEALAGDQVVEQVERLARPQTGEPR